MNVRLTVAAAVATTLGSISMYQLFNGLHWFFCGLGATIVIGLASTGARRLGGPAIGGLAIGAVAGLLYFTLVFASSQAILLVIPTPASLHHLGVLLSSGWSETSMYAAPVPPLPGMTMLTAVGIALVALLVDFLAVRLRHAALAGLPLLAMYSVPAAVHQASVNPFVFLLGAAGFLYLLLVGTGEHLSGWGRPVFTRRWTAELSWHRPDVSPLGITARRVGAVALAVAIIVPFVLPHVANKGVFGNHGGTQATVETPNPMVSLRQQLGQPENAVVLTYRTTDPNPDYLQMYALDRFDGVNWTYSPLQTSQSPHATSGKLPTPQGLTDVAATTTSTTVTVADGVQRMYFLPVPYAPTSLAIDGDWHVDPSTLMIFSLNDAAGGRTYTVKSLNVQPSPAQLDGAATVKDPPEIAARYLTVPNGIPSEVTQLAKKITKSATTPYAKAMALQSWFADSGTFTYNLNVPALNGTNALTSFLFKTHEGFCEQFSASMALMARLLGIPARVAVGYTSGTHTGPDTWTVRTSDTHAWPELYFPGIGWLRFEPTPSGINGQGTATVPTYSTVNATTTPGAPGNFRSVGAPPNLRERAGGQTGAERKLNLPGGGTSTPTTTETHGGFSYVWALVGAGVLALLGAAPAGIGAWVRRRRWVKAADDDAALAEAAWRELRGTAVDLGFDWRASDTPRLAVARLGAALGDDADGVDGALSRLRRASERASFATTPAPSTHLRTDLGEVRSALTNASRTRSRVRAKLWPASDLREAADGISAYWPSWRRRQRSSMRSMNDTFEG